MTDGDLSVSDARARLLENLGYEFRDASLLEQALTHPSVTDSHGVANNQRLEFLGDRVLGLVIADRLFGDDDGEGEGGLTRRYAECVENAALARIARDIGIGPALLAQPNTDLAETGKVIGDALEAVLGAIWRDGGMEAVRPVILRIWGDIIESGSGMKDSKSLLQEYAYGKKIAPPRYELVKQTGPGHNPEFTVAVILGDASAEARGSTKREAEQIAAARMLEQIS